MSFVSPLSPPTDSLLAPPSSTERRLRAEWSLLEQLAAANPERLTNIAANDFTFSLRLRQTPALLQKNPQQITTEHRVTIAFPQFFPAAPLELYLQTPIYHPNISPHTGFVCLWDRHRVSNTVEHALHKLVAILGWRLFNRHTTHLMQPEALLALEQQGEAVATMLSAPPLRGITSPPAIASAAAPQRTFRRRLS
jgi:ubiquitin-protein ligase